MCIRDRLAAGGVVLDDERGHVGIERHAEEHGGGQQREENSGRDDPLVVRDDETRDPIHHALQLFVLGDAMPLAATAAAAALTAVSVRDAALIPTTAGRTPPMRPRRRPLIIARPPASSRPPTSARGRRRAVLSEPACRLSIG